MYINRNIESFLKLNLQSFPAVVLLGTRQCGKSTLIKKMSVDFESFLYLDLQNYTDLNKLTDMNLFFTTNRNSTICIDEVQLVPTLFSFLRSEIDKYRHKGRFILLGSASQQLIQNTSESLAGRVGLVTLTPFTFYEVLKTSGFELKRHWFRGGYPDSYLAGNEDISKLWIENYIQTYIERDIPQFGIQIPPLQLRRLLIMLSHSQGQLINLSKLGESLGTSHTTIRKYIDLFEQTFILRTLMPYESNIKKRLIKSPKTYIRDSGILHRLLLIDNFNALLGNPINGSSWEGYVIENIITEMREFTPYFYRTSTGNEIDLILEKGDYRIAIECKMSSAPELTKGNWNALEDIKPDKTLIVIPTEACYEIKENIWVTGLENVAELIK
ncbi:MAG: ATP-binding protein [Deltaproteobacteria bacterium]